MKLDSLQKLYIYELKNLYSGENQAIEFLSSLAGQVACDSLRQTLVRQCEQSRRHTGRIESLFEGLDFSPGGQKCRGVAGMMAGAAKTMSAADSAEVRDQVTAITWQRVQVYLKTGYQVAFRYAEQLGRTGDMKYLAATLHEKHTAIAGLATQTRKQLIGVAERQSETQYPSLPSALKLPTPLSGRMLKSLLALIAVILIVATGVSLLPLPAWWVRMFDFPRVQIGVLASLVMGAYIFLMHRRWWPDRLLVMLLAVCIAYQAYRIYPYTPLASYQVLPNNSRDLGSRFQLLVANVLMENRDSEKLLDLIADTDPDLIIIVEPDRWWLGQLEVLHGRYAYTESYPLDNTYGLALYSRFQLIDPTIRFLIQDDVPSIHTRFKLPGGVEIELYALHPRPPSPTEHYRSTERDAELLVVGKAVRESSYPVVVAGDMNDVAWSRTTKRFQRISRLLDPRIGRGVYGTYHADYPLLRWPLDHIFISDELRLVAMRRLSAFGSDHFPIAITLSYEPAIDHGQNQPEAIEPEDKKEARETIKKALRANPGKIDQPI